MAPTQRAYDSLPDMCELLVRAGFRLRRATSAPGGFAGRADCARCTGRSRGTVSYNREVAHCFRCGWKASRFTLARELGLLRKGLRGLCAADPATRAKWREQARRRAHHEAQIARFAAWREARICALSDRYRALWRSAGRAREALRRSPDCQPAWEALARFYHAEACLSAALDFLTCAKASDWLDTDATPADVFQAWSAQKE